MLVIKMIILYAGISISFTHMSKKKKKLVRDANVQI